MAVHVTLVDADFVAATPLLFGANPVAVLHGPHAGLRTLGAEEDLARALLAQLRGDQKAIAIVDPVAPADILTKNYRNADASSIARGVAYEQLDAEQRGAGAAVGEDSGLTSRRQPLPRCAGSAIGRSADARTGTLLCRARSALPDRVRQHAE